MQIIQSFQFSVKLYRGQSHSLDFHPVPAHTCSKYCKRKHNFYPQTLLKKIFSYCYNLEDCLNYDNLPVIAA